MPPDFVSHKTSTYSDQRKTFLSLSRSEAVTIAKAVFKNSDHLIQAATKCSQDQAYGLAIFLSILGVEEMVKGTLVLMWGHGVKVEKIEEMRSAIISNHKTRHETAMLFQLLNVIVSIPDRLDNLDPKSFLKVFMKDPTKFLEELFGEDTMLATIDNLQWWEEANTFKNRGIYAEFKDKLVTPSDVTLQEYNTAKAHVDSTLDTIKRIHARFEDKSNVPELARNINSAFDFYLRSTGYVTKSKFEKETLPWPEYIPSNAKKLILGTFPTKKSNRSFEFFYPNTSNRFWSTLSKISNIPLTEFNGEAAVKQRKLILDTLRVGISDTGHKIYRQKESSLDDNIFPIEFTNVFKILDEHPSIDTVILTSSSKGNSALYWFMAYCELNNITLKLPKGKLPKQAILNILDRQVTIVAINSPSRAARISDQDLLKMYSDVMVNPPPELG